MCYSFEVVVIIFCVSLDGNVAPFSSAERAGSDLTPNEAANIVQEPIKSSSDGVNPKNGQQGVPSVDDLVS